MWFHMKHKHQSLGEKSCVCLTYPPPQPAFLCGILAFKLPPSLFPSVHWTCNHSLHNYIGYMQLLVHYFSYVHVRTVHENSLRHNMLDKARLAVSPCFQRVDFRESYQSSDGTLSMKAKHITNSFKLYLTKKSKYFLKNM